MATSIQKIHLRMKDAAKSGKLSSEITIFKSYIGILKSEGFQVTVLSQSEKNPGLVKVKVSWSNACNKISRSALQDYIDGTITVMPSRAFEFYVIACRAA